jgi:hypothetical protein
MPRAAAQGSAFASARSLMTATICARSRRASMLRTIACRLLPRPETSTTMRNDACVAGDAVFIRR